MAKKLVTVKSLLADYVLTGLPGEDGSDAPDYGAFVQYCQSEYGQIADVDTDCFDNITLSGKGDKAKGKLAKGTVEFKGGHNTALTTLAAAGLLRKLSESTNRVVGRLDAREAVKPWHERWLAKQAEKLQEA